MAVRDISVEPLLNSGFDKDLGSRGVLKVAVTDGVQDGQARLDGSTEALNFIDYVHHEIHAGSGFTTTYTQTVSDTGDKSIIAFLTDNSTKYVHLTVAASSTAAAIASILEAPTITNNTGATLAIYNRRRIGTPTTTTVWDTSQNPTAQGAGTFFTEITMGNVTGGTTLASIPLGAAAGGAVKQIGGLARGQQEWILKPNTAYAFVVESSDDADNTHWIEIDYYEHTDRNE